MSVRTCVCVCMHMYTCIYVCTCTYIRMCVHAHAYVQYVVVKQYLSSFASYVCVVTEESQRGQKHLPSSERESVRLRFEELEKQWAKLSRRGSTSSVQWRWSAPWDSRGECTCATTHTCSSTLCGVVKYCTYTCIHTYA